MNNEIAAATHPHRDTQLSVAASTLEREWPIDATRLQSLVADLRRNDERTKFALGVARAGVWEAELFTGQVEWSDTMHLAMGQSCFDGTIESMSALIHPEDRDKFSRVIHGNFDAPRDFQIDVRIPWPDRTLHYVQFRGQIAADPGGMSVRLISVAQDITEQKNLELKLRQAQKMEAMGRLAGGVAHDFNNILTAILGYAMLIESEPGEADSNANHASQIRKASERAAALTKQLLAFSRRQVIEKRVVYVSEVVEDLLPMLAKLLGEQIQIGCDVTDCHPVFADPGQLQQVVMNLAVNARDAMPQGGRLTITARNVTLGERDRMPRFKMVPGDYIVLSVTDTGSGMDAKTSSQIFEPFFTTKDAGQGTGLGLSNVFEIVKTLGGGIRVSSEPDQGTTFTIFLPRTEVATAGAVPQTGTAAVIGGPETVLVVEDEEGVRALVSDILTRKGYTVLTARDSVSALALIAESSRTPDLVLTDVMMPDGTGPELVDELSRLAGTSLRALYMSGYAGAVLARQGKLAADCQFLQKPFTAPQLLLRIRELFDDSQSSALAAAS